MYEDGQVLGSFPKSILIWILSLPQYFGFWKIFAMGCTSAPVRGNGGAVLAGEANGRGTLLSPQHTPLDLHIFHQDHSPVS
ncbi:hypothetical protein GN956_G14966 [Arapaima gigas]